MIEPSDAGALAWRSDAGSAGSIARSLDAAQRVSDAAADSSDASRGEAADERDKPESADAAVASRDCMPGMYTGTFSGSLYAGVVPVLGLTGLVNAELVRDAADKFLTVRDVRVEGHDPTGNTVSFTLSGRINCVSYALEDGLLREGILHLADVDTDLAMVGSATGSYIPDLPGVSGTWEAYADASSLLSGGGVFSILLAR